MWRVIFTTLLQHYSLFYLHFYYFILIFFSLLISLFSLLIFIFFFFFAVLSQDPRQSHGKQTQRLTANPNRRQTHGPPPHRDPKPKTHLKPKPPVNPNTTKKSTEERGELWRTKTVTRATENRGREPRIEGENGEKCEEREKFR